LRVSTKVESFAGAICSSKTSKNGYVSFGMFYAPEEQKFVATFTYSSLAPERGVLSKFIKNP